MENSVVHTECTPIDLTHTVLSFSEAPLHVVTGKRLPNTHVTSAHGRTPKRYRCHGSFSCHRTDHEGSRRTNDSLVLSQHPSTIEAICLSAPLTRARTAMIAPLKVVARTIASLFMHLVIASFSKTFVPRSLGFSFVPQRTTTKCPSRRA